MKQYYLQRRWKTSIPYEQFDKLIIRYSPNEIVEINENVDIPAITVDLDLLKEKSFPCPKNDELDKYKKITKEDFYNYLSVSLDAFKTFKSRESEIYFDKPFTSRYEIVQFSTDPKNKFRFHIEVNFDIEWGQVAANISYSFSRRKHYRENGIPISDELFRYLKFKTYEYLSDDLNYLKNFKQYLETIDLSYKGKIKPELPTGDFDINPLLTELSNQIRQLESRLLNNDTDKRATREKIRGRIEGLKSAISEITSYFADNINNAQ